MASKHDRPTRLERQLALEVTEKSAQLERYRSDIVRIAKLALDFRIALAARQGYIDRVQEVEQRAQPASGDGVVVDDPIEKLRRLMAYSPDREASAIIDVISPELMERVLGRPDGGIDG